MMAPANHFKLGLFVLFGIIAVVFAAAALGANALRRDTMVYHTYFNESVQGLEIGSPVKYRGVPIGTISAIDMAPDRRHVGVSLELYTKELKRLGLTTESTGGVVGTRFTIPDDLRTQLASQGITGV